MNISSIVLKLKKGYRALMDKLFTGYPSAQSKRGSDVMKDAELVFHVIFDIVQSYWRIRHNCLERHCVCEADC